MKRQFGVSLVSFLWSSVLASALLATTLSVGVNLYRQSLQKEAFSLELSSLVSALNAAITYQWQDSGCRALSELPSLEQLIAQFHASPTLRTSQFTYHYHATTASTVSAGLIIRVAAPAHVNLNALMSSAIKWVDDARLDVNGLTLYQHLPSVRSWQQHQHFDGETGCLQPEETE